MEVLGWILAVIAVVFSIGLVIGVVLTSSRDINVTQITDVTQTNTTNDSAGDTKQGPSAPAIFPIAAVLIIGAIAVAAMSNSATSGAQVTAISQQAIRAIPTQTPPVVIDRPVASLDKPVSFAEVAVSVTAIVNVIVWSVAGREYIKTRRAKSKRRASRQQQPSGIAVPLFNQSNHEVKR